MAESKPYSRCRRQKPVKLDKDRTRRIVAGSKIGWVRHMDIGGNIEIVDHYEWFPGCREANLKIRMENGDLCVTIVYEGPQGTNERILNFSFVCSFAMETVSPEPHPCEHDGGVPNGAVVEYPDSEDAIAWSKHLGGWRLVRHYSIALLSENLLLVVLAGGFSRAD